MNNNQINSKRETSRPIYLYYVYGVIIITVILIVLRIVFYFDDTSRFAELRDVDYRTLYDLSGSELPNYYSQSSIAGFRPIYLYYWNFMFYPFSIIPLEIGVYIWDALRLITTIYIAKKVYEINDNSKDLIAFFILSGIGYFADAYLNNTNWLLYTLLFLSYISLENDKKWLAGIFFTLAMYKINIIVFPFILLIVQKIKFKDLVYYIIPFALLCIPYLIFPEYLSQMVYNWTYVEEGPTDPPLILRIYLMSWQAFQTAQLMYMSFILLIFLANIKDEQWQDRYRWTVFAFLIIINLSFPIVLWQVT